MKWRIYYDDGSTRDWQEGLPETEGQRLGIQCIVQQRSNDHVFVTQHGAEYYIYVDDTEWISCYQNGLEDWAMNCLDRINCVIKGRAIHKAKFREIFDRAKADAAKATLD